MTIRQALLVGLCMYTGLIVLRVDAAYSDKLFMLALFGIGLGCYGGACEAEGVVKGKKQAGRDLRGP